MIVYTLIAKSKDGSILVESSLPDLEGNYPQICSQLIQNLVSSNVIPVGNRKTLVQSEMRQSSDTNNRGNNTAINNLWCGMEDYFNINSSYTTAVDHYFHIERGEGLYYLCISDDNKGKQQSVNFAFLLEVQKEFTNAYSVSKISRAKAYDMNKLFTKKLFELMHYYNTKREELMTDEKISKLTVQVETLKSIMGDNIHLLLKRGDVLEEMLQSSEIMADDAKMFTRRSQVLERQSFQDKVKWTFVSWVLVPMTILFLIYCIIAIPKRIWRHITHNNNGNYYRNNNNNDDDVLFWVSLVLVMLLLGFCIKMVPGGFWNHVRNNFVGYG